jgi:DNA-directed RNA polymerase subunit H (RpoH/RPB5)
MELSTITELSAITELSVITGLPAITELPAEVRCFLKARRLQVSHTLAVPKQLGLNGLRVYELQATSPTLICYSDAPSVGIQEVRKVMECFQGLKLFLFMDISAQALQHLEEQPRVTHTNRTLFQFDRAEHISVSRYVVLDDKQKAEFLATFKVTTDQLPVLKLEDPICQYLGIPKHCIVHAIDRNIYRYVC